MTPREILAAAWAITVREKSLRRWGYTATILETLLEAKLILYQTYFLYKYLSTGTGAGFFDLEEKLFYAVPLWFFLTLVILFSLAVLVEFFLPKMCLGAIIGLGAKSYRKEELRGGLVLALYNFFPIFTIHELAPFRSITTTITAISLILRYGSGGMQIPAIIFVCAFWLLSLLFHFFACFAEEAAVIRKVSIFRAIGQSVKLVISNLHHIVFLLLFLFIISLRIAINTIVIFFVPGIGIGLSILLSLILPSAVSYAIAAAITLAALAGLSYLLAYLNVFRQTVWTVTYLELSTKKELDVIVE